MVESALRGQYKGVADDLMKAQAGARMASEQRGERLSLVEPAVLPDQPNWPNRPIADCRGCACGRGAWVCFWRSIIEILQAAAPQPGSA